MKTEDKTGTELATQEQSTAVATSSKRQAKRYSDEQIAAAALDSTTAVAPKLADAPASPISMAESYWSPENEGESKVGFIKCIETKMMPDMETGEVKELECLVFIEEKPEGKGYESFISAARILVANVKDAIERGEIVPSTFLTPVRITYLGQKKNRSNAFKSGRWDIRRLMVAVQ